MSLDHYRFGWSEPAQGTAEDLGMGLLVAHGGGRGHVIEVMSHTEISDQVSQFREVLGNDDVPEVLLGESAVRA